MSFGIDNLAVKFLKKSLIGVEMPHAFYVDILRLVCIIFLVIVLAKEYINF